MLRAWVGPGGESFAAAVESLGESVEQADAELWVLSSPLDAAVQLAQAARPDQVVIYAADPQDLAHAWPHLGVAFDEVVRSDVTADELAARVRAHRSDRRALPRSRVLRLLAHDLNNPLTAIRLLSEMLVFEVPGDEAKEDLTDILEASDVAAALVESVGAYAKLDIADRGQSVTIDVSNVLNDAARRPSLRASMELDLPRGPLPVRGDRGAITQAIQDVLLNARRLGENHGPSKVNVTVDGTHVHIEVVTRVSQVPANIDVLRVEHGATLLRDRRIPVSPTGLVHAHRTAEGLGGRLEIQPGPQTITVRLVLPLSA